MTSTPFGNHSRPWNVSANYTQVSAPTAACTENSSHRLYLYLGPTWSQPTATWHRHTSRVTNVCRASRCRVPTQPACLVRVTVPGHSQLYRDTCYCHLCVDTTCLITDGVILKRTRLSRTGFTTEVGIYDAGRIWGMGSLKLARADKGLVFKVPIVWWRLYKIWKRHTPCAQLPWLCCFPDKRTRQRRHVTPPTCTVRSIPTPLGAPALLPHRARALLPCRPADSRPGSTDFQHTRPIPSRAVRSAVRKWS